MCLPIRHLRVLCSLLQAFCWITTALSGGMCCKLSLLIDLEYLYNTFPHPVRTEWNCVPARKVIEVINPNYKKWKVKKNVIKNSWNTCVDSSLHNYQKRGSATYGALSWRKAFSTMVPVRHLIMATSIGGPSLLTWRIRTLQEGKWSFKLCGSKVKRVLKVTCCTLNCI